MNLQEMLELAGDEILSAMNELEKRGITVSHVDVVIEPIITSASGAAECVKTISVRMTPNAQTEPRSWLARSVLLGAQSVTAMIVGSSALLASVVFIYYVRYRGAARLLS